MQTGLNKLPLTWGEGNTRNWVFARFKRRSHGPRLHVQRADATVGAGGVNQPVLTREGQGGDTPVSNECAHTCVTVTCSQQHGGTGLAVS